MKKTRQQIECLKRLNDMTAQLDDILIFLKEEGLIDETQVKSVKSSADHPKETEIILGELQRTNRLQMLQYTWTILPVENIIIELITDRNRKEFTFEG